VRDSESRSNVSTCHALIITFLILTFQRHLQSAFEFRTNGPNNLPTSRDHRKGLSLIRQSPATVYTATDSTFSYDKLEREILRSETLMTLSLRDQIFSRQKVVVTFVVRHCHRLCRSLSQCVCKWHGVFCGSETLGSSNHFNKQLVPILGLR
jgi:hypothetical protein